MSPRAGDMECVAIARNSACNLGFDFANNSPSYAIRPSLLIVLKFGTQRVALQTQLQQAWGPDVNKDGFNWALTAGEQSVNEFQNSEGVVFALNDVGGTNHEIDDGNGQKRLNGPPPHGLNIARGSLVIQGMWLASV